MGRYRTELSLVAAIIAVVAFTAWRSDAYAANPAGNAAEIVRQTALLGVFTLGAFVVIISGGIDLSAGSMIALSACVCGAVINAQAPLDEAGQPVTTELGWPILLAGITAAILMGLAVGTLHAWLITVVGLPPFVATLASLVGLRSLAIVFSQEVNQKLTGSQSTQFYVYDPRFMHLGEHWLPPLATFLALGLLTWGMMSRTVLGRQLTAMGGNEAAARLSGIRTDRLKWFAYCFSAVTASIAGVLFMAAVGVADPSTMGRGYELNAIAASVVGGCSLQGGIGLVPGAMLGVLFLRVVIDCVAKVVGTGADYFEGIIVGFLVALAVALSGGRVAGVRRKFFAGPLGLLAIVILSAFFAVMVQVSMHGYGGLSFAGAAVLLLALKVAESLPARKAAP